MFTFPFLSLTLFRSPSPTHYLICFSIIYLFYCSPSDWVAKGKQIKSRQSFNFIDLFWSDNVTLPRAQLLQQEQVTYSKDEAVEWYWKVRSLVGNCYPVTLYKRLPGHWDWNKYQSKEGMGQGQGYQAGRNTCLLFQGDSSPCLHCTRRWAKWGIYLYRRNALQLIPSWNFYGNFQVATESPEFGTLFELRIYLNAHSNFGSTWSVNFLDTLATIFPLRIWEQESW